MASSITGFTHTNPATSGAGTSLGVSAAVGDVILVFSGDGSGAAATASCSGATCTLTSRKQQAGNDGLAITTAFTGIVTVAGTPTIAVTSAGGNLRWDAMIISGLSSEVPDATSGASFPADTTPYTSSITTSDVCLILNYWANNSTDPFVSWRLSATQLSYDSGSRWSGSAYLSDQAAGTYAMGMNSNSTGSNRLSMISIALLVATSANNQVFYLVA